MNKGLSREQIVATALEIADRDGLGALTMRRIAGALDVEAMSLYRHVRNKDDLLDGLHDALIGSLVVPTEGPWEARVEAVALGFRDVLARHPRLVRVLASRPATTPRALQVLADGVRTLEEAGFAEDDAVIAFQTVFCFVVGHCVFHMADGQPPDAWADTELAGGLAILVEGLRARVAPSTR
ncbi:MAG: TetR/AcrR family transcriptional regulator C-terminal domain-containing protein [Alphaproteobacteria bacterium]|nr:TetR/AcrR family transcriptional regulator C-terminal domain-containing protein [Alphaproteobacteria bacterium]